MRPVDDEPLQQHLRLDSSRKALHMVDRARGCIGALMCADALGAAVEGFDPKSIQEVAQQHCAGAEEVI